jgi:hypothetical protein
MAAAGETGLRAGALTVGLLSEAIRVEIMRALAGPFTALSIPEDYKGEVHPHPRVELDEPVDPEMEQKYVLSPLGRARLPTADAIELWLLKAPGGPLAYDDRRAKWAIELLSEAWGHGLVHAFAAGPTGTADAIARCEIPYRPAKRLLAKLCRVGLAEVVTDPGGTQLHAPTEWLRRAIGPLTSAARVESVDPPAGARPVDALDVEAAMQLAVPLVRLGEEACGTCRLVVRVGPAGRRYPAGATVGIREGQILSCQPELKSDADAEAVGELGPWFGALIDRRPRRLRFEGDHRLAHDLVAAVGTALFDESSFVR